MKCTECSDYKTCLKQNDLRSKRSRCPKAKDIRFLTNADRIRAMTDEELAQWLDRQTGDCCDCNGNEGHNADCPIYKGGRFCLPRDIMAWLKQPAEEG